MSSSRDALVNLIDWEGDLEWIELPVSDAQTPSLQLPGTWHAALTGEKSTSARVAELWSELAEMLPEAVAAYAKARDLVLLRTRERGLTLVYFFGSGEDATWRRGFLPAQLPDVASRLPPFVTALYALHNGLVHPASHDGGPLPSSDWRELKEDEEVAPMVIIASDGSSAFGFDLAASGKAYSIDGDVDEVADPRAFLDEMIAGYLASL